MLATFCSTPLRGPFKRALEIHHSLTPGAGIPTRPIPMLQNIFMVSLCSRRFIVYWKRHQACLPQQCGYSLGRTTWEVCFNSTANTVDPFGDYKEQLVLISLSPSQYENHLQRFRPTRYLGSITL